MLIKPLITPRLCTQSVTVYQDLSCHHRGDSGGMLFANDLVICGGSRERTEERLENWRGCLEDAGLKVSVSKMEHLPWKSAGNLQKINEGV